MPFIAYALVVLGYGLLYTGLSNFSGNNIGLFQALGYSGNKDIHIDPTQYDYTNPVANMTAQPAVYNQGTGISGSYGV